MVKYTHVWSLSFNFPYLYHSSSLLDFNACQVIPADPEGPKPDIPDEVLETERKSVMCWYMSFVKFSIYVYIYRYRFFCGVNIYICKYSVLPGEENNLECCQ